MIKFKRENGNYHLPDGTVLPLKELLKYPHEIDGDYGTINMGVSIGDEVYKLPSTLDMEISLYTKTGIIKSFTVFGGVLCARFEETNCPHRIDCLSLVN